MGARINGEIFKRGTQSFEEAMREKLALQNAPKPTQG